MDKVEISGAEIVEIHANEDDDYDGGDTVYVAMGEDVEELKKNLIYTLDTLKTRKICILHIQVPPQEIPFRAAMFLRSAHKEDRLREYEENERRKVQNVIIKGCMLICQQARVSVKILYAERDSIEIGIVELIHTHNIRKLLLGAKQGEYICKHAPKFCSIWILDKWNPTHTRNLRVIEGCDGSSSPLNIKSEMGSSSATGMATAIPLNDQMKVSHGPGGYILEDVPHLTDYIPDIPAYSNPLRKNPAYSVVKQYFVDMDDTVPKNIVVHTDTPRGVHFRRAGPRQKVYFSSDEVSACIVTCGGLCPGLNTVIREIVHSLDNMYGVRKVLGIDGGYRGFYAKNTIPLTPKNVNDIHKRGGTMLGSSRGGHDTKKIVDSIQDRGINQVYIIGGDGTQKGAAFIYEEIKRRGLKVSVAGIPKTIDNDIPIIDRSFGFDTAVEEAQRAINAAHVEAESAENGLGVVKLMGRYCGFIAMHATLASRDVDCCLIPESPFYLEGKGGLFEYVERRLKENGHMVIVIAEGAGQELLKKEIELADEQDASGNKLLKDVGLWLSNKIKGFAKQRKMPLTLKYIDPTYMIRAIPSNAADNVYCTLLAQSAVHGAMAGYTGFTSGLVHGRHTYIPFNRITEKQNNVVITDRMWARLLSSTNQPSFLSAKQLHEAQNDEPLCPSIDEISGN